jgi:hypothetical protein
LVHHPVHIATRICMSSHPIPFIALIILQTSFAKHREKARRNDFKLGGNKESSYPPKYMYKQLTFMR